MIERLMETEYQPPWLRNATTVITHKGRAHFDEFASCCVLLALRPGLVIERRDYTINEFGHNQVLIVDQGRKFMQSRGLFDHHQFPRTDPPCCSLTLIVDALGFSAEAKKFWKWLPFREAIDSKGKDYVANLAWESFRVAGGAELPVPATEWQKEHLWKNVLRPTNSPVEEAVLRLFRDESHVAPGTPVHDLMKYIGCSLVGGLARAAARYKDLPKHVQISSHAADFEIQVAVVDYPRDQAPTLALDEYLDDNYPSTEVTVTADDRGPGVCLYRRKGDRVDFMRIDGCDHVTFAHRSGHMAKVSGKASPNRVMSLIKWAAE